MNSIKETLQSIAHVRTASEISFNFIITIFSAILGYFQVSIIKNQDLFIAVLLVVIGDWIFGTIRAIKNKNWRTDKAMKIVYYIFAYSTIVFVVLAIEKAYPSAFFLADAIIMPILIFQAISMIKNISLLGWIPNGLLLDILEKIDSYKSDLKTSDLRNQEEKPSETDEQAN